MLRILGKPQFGAVGFAVRAGKVPPTAEPRGWQTYIGPQRLINSKAACPDVLNKLTDRLSPGRVGFCLFLPTRPVSYQQRNNRDF
jgi:hypothetical protein